MNIFYLERTPKLCAMSHHDSHVIKMILEYSQLLSTAHRVLDGHEVIVNYVDKNGKNKTRKEYHLDDKVMNGMLYKATHRNHPSAIWVREHEQNYRFLYMLLCECINEYQFRFGKIHACRKLLNCLRHSPKNIERSPQPFVEPHLAMPDEYKVIGCNILSYRKYYNLAKQFKKNGSENRYTKRSKPNWLGW